MRLRTGLLRVWVVLSCAWMVVAAGLMFSTLQPLWHWPAAWPERPRSIADLTWLQEWGGWSERDVVERLDPSGGYEFAAARLVGYSDKRSVTTS